mmetsp:Transcript_66455/g.176753  ORF Transcript_66455/g.176753 Transcript_66455/m.176753 type:complete len:180 (-) Transcript_66455:52-591(-)
MDVSECAGFAPVEPHPSKTVKRDDVHVMLHEEGVTESAPIVKILREFIPGPEKRVVIVCESFDCEGVLPKLLEVFDERLNIVIVECPGFKAGRKDHLHDLARLSGARIIAESRPDSSEESPLGMVGNVFVKDNNITTFTVGDEVVVIDDSLEVMTVHATEEGEENPEELAARLACEMED